jgi:putative colanic acid biosynthesis acetyltransferase WcaF
MVMGGVQGAGQSSQDTVLLSAQDAGPWEGGASFSIGNRLYRLLWAVTWALLASWTPPPLRGWRRWLLVRFGASLAPTANVYSSARIWSPANLKMGDYAAIGPRAIIYSMGPITLGDYAIISQGAHLCAGTHDIEDVHFQLKARPIEIGRRAWVAAEAFVGPGVTVGEGAVLGARSCAMRDIAPWSVCTGNPANELRQRHIRFD